MRYKVHEKPFTPNQKTLSSDTEKILDQMQNNFNESFVKKQSSNNDTSIKNEKPVNNNFETEQNNSNNTNTNGFGALFNGLNSGGSIEKLLPLLMLMNKQNVSSQNTQTQSENNETNPNMNMFKLLSESGLLGKNFSPEKLKLFELIMNMNNQKNKPNNSTQENETTKNPNKTKQNEEDVFNETQEENEINNFETNKSVR